MKIVNLILVISVLMSFLLSPALAENNDVVRDTALSLEEAEYLTYMREEEKLARDVYLLMYKTWDFDTFLNIAGAQQKHMDALLSELIKYHMPDPVGDNDEGEFTNLRLQDLYDNLVDLGIASFIAALDVGGIIEETNIIDIQESIEHTNHADVIHTYEKLLDGSKSHLRAFVKDLETQGIIYVPKLISQELFDEIIREK